MAKQLNKIKELISEFKKSEEELVKKLKENFKTITEEIFAEFPNLEYISWEQYAPSFNDGDACEFGVYEPTFVFKKTDEEIAAINEDEEDEDEDYDVSRVFSRGIDEDSRHFTATDYPDEKKYKSLRDFSNMITDSSMENVLRSTFGSDHSIVIHRSGKIDTSYAEHD